MSMVFKTWTGIYRQNIPLLLICSSRRRYASTKEAKTKIGFIGLGNMGSPMAKNIISKRSVLKGSIISPKMIFLCVLDVGGMGICHARTGDAHFHDYSDPAYHSLKTSALEFTKFARTSTDGICCIYSNIAEALATIIISLRCLEETQQMEYAGHDVIVYDVRKESLTDLQEHGAEISNSPKDVAEKVDCIITMLSNNDIVLDVYQGEQGILKSVKKGTLLIDSSTVNPQVPKTLATSAEKKEAILVDAPVSGGVNAARLGQLTFMVGGPTESFPSVQEVLFTMGSRVVHCGPVGSGQASKICNNMLLGISMIGTAEAMNLGVRLGLDPTILLNIFNSSTGRCWSSEVYSPVPGTMENVPSSNNYQGGFGTKLMSKDLGIAQEVAAKTTTPTPLGSLAHELYDRMAKKGYAEKDFSSIYEFLKDQNRE